ncbi:MAG: hypothetical protein WCX65_03135 [bacterium]
MEENKRATKRKGCLFIVVLLSVAIVGVILFYPFGGVIPNDLRMYAFSKRMTNVALPDNTQIIKQFNHIGLTVYNGNYCGFVVAELLKSKLTQEDIGKAYIKKTITGVDGNSVPLKLAFFDKEKQKLIPYREEDDWFVENFIYTQFLKPNSDLLKQGDGKSNFYMLYVEDSRMDFDGSGFDWRCM